MELAQLRTFVAVAEELHFGHAALRLHTAQPALSQGIKRLERELGVLLFERTTRRVALTEAGRVLLEHARQILPSVEAAEEAVRRVQEGQRGTLRVGCTTLAPHRLLPRLADSYGSHHPDVRLCPANIPSVRQIQLLSQGRLDAGLLWLPPANGACDFDRVSYRALAVQELVAVLPPGHRFASAPRIAPMELSKESFITYIQIPGGSVIREMATRACHEAGFHPRIVQEAPDVYSMLAMVGAGVGIALLPECAQDINVSGLPMLPIDESNTWFSFVLAWRGNDSRSIVSGLLESVFDLEPSQEPSS